MKVREWPTYGPERHKDKSDKELDFLLASMVDMATSYAKKFGNSNTMLEMECSCLHKEWERRYPDTIAPSLHKRQMEKGGFPECYTGPRETVNLDEGEDYEA